MTAEAHYVNVRGEVRTDDDINRIQWVDHALGPVRHRVLCRCGRQFWGDTWHEARSKALAHQQEQVGWPLYVDTGEQP